MTAGLWVAGFGMVGVLSRFWIDQWWANSHPEAGFPAHTFLINAAGSFLIGIIYVLSLEKWASSEGFFTGMSVGLLGGFTTFSAFSLQTLMLLEKGKFPQTALYFFGSPTLGLISASVGVFLARYVLGKS